MKSAIWVMLAVSSQLMGAPERACLPPGAAPVKIALSVNIDSAIPAMALNKAMQERKLRVAEKNDAPETQFLASEILPGDCLFFNRAETEKLLQGISEREMTPAILFKSSDGSKQFGLVDTASLSALVPDKKHREARTPALLAYRGKHQDLTVVYVTCPSSREKPCRLKIRKNGKWIAFERPVLARSRRGSREPSRRISIGGDTPQGIYYLWATMFTSGNAYGGLPRIVLDAATPPPNSYPYEINSYVLSELVPDSARDDYWVNEAALAFRLGRISLRIHSSSPEARDAKSFEQTEGCISAGDGMRPLLEKLVALGALAPDTLKTKPDPSTRGWKVSPAIGRAFVVVKDED